MFYKLEIFLDRLCVYSYYRNKREDGLKQFCSEVVQQNCFRSWKHTKHTAGSSQGFTAQINKAGFTGFYKHRLYCVIAKTAERVSHHLSCIMGNDRELTIILNFLQEGRNSITLCQYLNSPNMILSRCCMRQM